MPRQPNVSTMVNLPRLLLSYPPWSCHEHLLFSLIPPFYYPCVDHMINIISSLFYFPYHSNVPPYLCLSHSNLTSLLSRIISLIVLCFYLSFCLHSLLSI